MREGRQERLTRLLLEARGVAYRKDGRGGWPDRIALGGHGHHVWVEHKTNRGRLTPAQRRVFPKLEAAGDVVVYGRGKTPEQIANEVEAHLGLEVQGPTPPFIIGDLL